MRAPGRPTLRMLLLLLLATVLTSRGAAAQPCAGDCNGNGQVTIEELIRGVNIALGTLPATECTALDRDGGGHVTINELVAAVASALDGCARPSATPTPSATSGETPTATPTSDGVTRVADAVARDAQGVAVQLGNQLTIEGVVTVDAGLFANNKLKVFVQQDGAGIMVYHNNAADADALQAGDRIRVSGVIRQADPSSAMNAATGTVLIDITGTTPLLLGGGNPLPTPVPVTLAALMAQGNALTGTLVRTAGAHKVDGDWPMLGGRSSQVTVGDGSGADLVLRFQRLTISAPLVDELTAIGDGPFDLTAIVVQDDADPSDGLFAGYELWVRGADDISSPP